MDRRVHLQAQPVPVTTHSAQSSFQSRAVAKKSSQVAEALKRLDHILQLIKPSPDPRIFELNWINMGVPNPQQLSDQWKNMQKMLKAHKNQLNKYQGIKRLMQSMTPEILIAVFTEENFINMVRNIKDAIRKTHDRTDQLIASVKEIKRTLKKLNIEGFDMDSLGINQSLRPSKSSLE